jgi:hypothetical protein
MELGECRGQVGGVRSALVVMQGLRMTSGVLGMVGAGLAILFGAWVVIGAMIALPDLTAYAGIWVVLLAGGAAVAGGILYLLGLMRWRGAVGFRARLAGFLLFGMAFLLPTSVWMFQLGAVVLALPGVFLGERPRAPVTA